MTYPLFRDDAYTRDAPATVVGIHDLGGIILDRSLFYPTGGGQPGDNGYLIAGSDRIEISTTVKGEGGTCVLVPTQETSLAVGDVVTQYLDWDRRFFYMRVHTALHLLSVVIPLPVTGGQISAEKGRLDFNMPEALEDKDAVADGLNVLIDRGLDISESWITDVELAANPGLVKTMSVQPPSGTGRVRLVRIGSESEQVDLQPCGGTHVRNTSEIGHIRIGKVQKKGQMNRRVNLHLLD